MQKLEILVTEIETSQELDPQKVIKILENIETNLKTDFSTKFMIGVF